MIRYSSIFFLSLFNFFFFWDKLKVLKKIVFIFNNIKFYLILDIENITIIF